MSGSAYKALPEPTVVNPLAAVKSGIEAANAEYGVREKQADAAWGNALQQATDQKTGVVDYDAAARIAAGNPAAQQGMAKHLQNQSNIKSQQLEQAGSLYNMIGRLSASGMNDPSDANIAAIRAAAVNANLPPGALREIDRIAAIPDQNQRRQEFYNHNLGSLDAHQRLQQELGVTAQVTYGDVNAPTTIRQGAPGRPASVAIGAPTTIGPPPDSTQTVKEWVKDGVVVPSSTPGASERTRVVPTAGNVVPSGGQQVTGGGTGTGAGTGAGPPIPPPAGTAIVGGYTGRPGATAPATPNAPAVTAAPASAAPAASPFGTGAFGGGSSVAPAPATPAPAPVTPPVATPAPAGLVTSTAPPIGAREAQDLSAKQWAADQADAGNFQARMFPLVQAHSILKNNPDVTTGVGAQAVSTIKSGLQTLTSIFTPADMQSIRQANFEELGKYMQQAVNANPFSASSDAKLAAAVSGNPSMHLSTLANKDVFKAMIALERTKQAAVNDFQNSGKTGAEWGTFKSTWQTEHDPRAFATDMMDDTQLRNMLTKMSPSELTAYQKTIKLIQDNPSIMNTSAMPHAAATPTAAPTNALAMAPQQSGNPLLAA